MATTLAQKGQADFCRSIKHVLPQVIAATNRVLVTNGDYDLVVITNGTRMAIQNMTWNGELGLRTAPSTPINS